jgi:tetratricopeptide (TPR) repeat protein
LVESLAEATNALGWGYRLIGKLDEALDCYREALLITLDTNNIQVQASILNNMGYIYALHRNINDALQSCNQALEMWNRLDCAGDYECERERKRNIGMVYGTIANILPEFNQFEEALSYRQKALDIFEPMQDMERLGSNYLSRGITYWLMGNVDAALQDLKKSQGFDIEYQRHVVLHYLAHIHSDMGNFERALFLFQRSQAISESLPDPFYELNNLGDLARLAVRQAQFARWQEFEQKLMDYKDKWPTDMVKYDLPEGILYKNLGDLAFGAGQISKAVEFYQKGFLPIAKAGGYASYTIAAQLEDIEQQFGSKTELSLLGEKLMQFWLDEQGMNRRHSEALIILSKWKRRQV